MFLWGSFPRPRRPSARGPAPPGTHRGRLVAEPPLAIAFVNPDAALIALPAHEMDSIARPNLGIKPLAGALGKWQPSIRTVKRYGQEHITAPVLKLWARSTFTEMIFSEELSSLTAGGERRSPGRSPWPSRSKGQPLEGCQAKPVESCARPSRSKTSSPRLPGASDLLYHFAWPELLHERRVGLIDLRGVM